MKDVAQQLDAIANDLDDAADEKDEEMLQHSMLIDFGFSNPFVSILIRLPGFREITLRADDGVPVHAAV